MSEAMEWPESVVEAAAEALWRTLPPGCTWEEMPRVYQDVHRTEARAALSCPAVQQHITALRKQDRAQARADALREAAGVAFRCTPRGHEGCDGSYNRGVNTGTMHARFDIERDILALLPADAPPPANTGDTP